MRSVFMVIDKSPSPTVAPHLGSPPGCRGGLVTPRKRFIIYVWSRLAKNTHMWLFKFIYVNIL